MVQLWDAKTKNLYGYNGSGRAPRNLTLDAMRQLVNDVSPDGYIPASGKTGRRLEQIEDGYPRQSAHRWPSVPELRLRNFPQHISYLSHLFTAAFLPQGRCL